jgi:hypothetical protein
MKACKDCNKSKKLSEFSKDKSQKDSLSKYCRGCMSLRFKAYRDKNKSDLDLKYSVWAEENKEHIKAKGKKYYSENKYSILKRKKIERDEDPEKYKAISLKSRNKHKETTNKYALKYSKARKAADKEYKILCNLRTRMSQVLRGNSKSEPTIDLLGCSLDYFKGYLESLFLAGMSWENYGRKGWHIDHIKPCVLFDLTIPTQQKECFHYKNLQPLWAIDNLKKGSRYCV